ncbi:alpha/beta fold hydrolase [Rugosimonospora acidiphila]|uniref:Alpha/beta fold hydrolase n=1 Tax=Rugosimonospora acidiphila TaxID=556531 RepID=A0ABP9RK63_9ACTN
MSPIDERIPTEHVEPTDERFTVAPGVGLHLRRWPGQRRPFLLVHGLSSNARLWDGVARILSAAGHPVTAVDLRSHGGSDAPPDGYDTATAAEDLAALGIRGAVVAGQSWGGNVVVSFAARHPELTAALALVDGGWLAPSAEFPSWEACESALRPPEIDGLPASRLREYLRDSHPDWSAEALAATEANLRVWPDGSLSRRLSVARHMSIVRSMWDDPPQPYYPDITVPVLLIPALPGNPTEAAARRSRVEAAAGALRDARIREYPAADHDLHAQHPTELAEDLLGLAAQVLP